MARKSWHWHSLSRAGLFLLALLAASAALAEDAAQIYRQNCMSCHTIGGGRLVGPDLKDVTDRKDRPWLEDFVVNPKKYLDANDPYAMKLKEDARGAIMPNIAGMTPAKAAALLDLIVAESKLPKSQFIGLNIGDHPFTEADILSGYQYFTGEKRLANGAAPCNSCHNAKGMTGLGGGHLAPDLTRVYERMQGRKNLSSWLQAPATPTMQPLFLQSSLTNDEIVSLVAFLEAEARAGGEADNSGQLAFLFLGLGGAVFGFIGADFLWRGRFRGVRKALTRGEK